MAGLPLLQILGGLLHLSSPLFSPRPLVPFLALFS